MIHLLITAIVPYTSKNLILWPGSPIPTALRHRVCHVISLRVHIISFM